MRERVTFQVRVNVDNLSGQSLADLLLRRSQKIDRLTLRSRERIQHGVRSGASWQRPG